MTDPTLDIYFELERSAHVELQTLAQSIVEFHRAAIEIAYLVDPSAKLRLELERGDEGSLRLKTIIRSLTPSTDTLRTVAVAIATTLALDAKSYIAGRGFEEIESYVRGEAEGYNLSDQDIRRIAAQVVEAMRNRSVEEPKRRFYESLINDPAVKGVGTTARRDADPRIVVPRSEFEERATPFGDQIEPGEKRTRTRKVEVLLLSPYLADKRRRWKFALDGLEFGATIDDEQFLHAVLSGEMHIAMKQGVVLEVTLEQREEFKDGVWTAAEYSIKEVHNVREAQSQGTFSLSPNDEDNQNGG